MAKKIDYASMYTLRSDGRYMGYWHDTDGRRHAIYDRDPEALHRKILSKEKETPSAPTFAEMADAWLEAHVDNLSRGTQTTYRAPLQQLKDELSQKSIDEITAGDINRILLAEKTARRSYKHAALIKSVAKQILDYAITEGHLQYNPVLSVNVPRGLKKGRREAPSMEEQQIIAANLDKPFGKFVATLLYTGARTEEVVALHYGDVDYAQDVIHIHAAVDLHGTPMLKETKTKAGERYVPLLPQLKPHLAKPVDARDDDLIFSDGGKLLTRSQISSRWLTWCKAAGLAEQIVFDNRHRGERQCTRTEWRPLITPHQLRHNYATVLYEQGVSELTAQRVMGHKDISTTHAIYTSLRDGLYNSEVDKIKNGF